MELKSFSHSCGESNFHIVFCPKRRRLIFGNKRIKAVCEYSFFEAAERHKITIRVVKIKYDHVHTFVSLTSWQSPAFAVHKLKGCSAHKPFEVFPWFEKFFKKRHFWSRGYFFRSVGSTTDQAVEFYIRVSQDKILRDKYYTYVGRTTRPARTTGDPYVEYLESQTRITNHTRCSHF